MIKKLVIFLAIVLVIGIGYVYLISLDRDDINLQMAAVESINIDDKATVKVFFDYKLDSRPLFFSENNIRVSWDEDWKIYGYNLKTNGRYIEDDKILRYEESYKDNINISIDKKLNLDSNNTGQGYIILIAKDLESINSKVYSVADSQYNYRDIFKKFSLGSGISWKNKEIIEE